MLTAGTVVAEHLRLVRQLGSGGMGSVWIAEQTRLGQHVAVKFLSTALLDHESARSRFDREAKLAAKIKSPHVVQIHDHGLTRGEPAIPYIVMELLDGQDLSKLLESEGPLGLGRASEVLNQVCDALTKAHEAGIVHRDIKPENVFVLNEARTFVKLLDFGVAHGKDGQIDRLTQTGLLLGTAHYMSPEQLFSGKDIDARADLWALAVLTYQMLSNELPFQAETFGQLCLRVRDGGFAPISSQVNVPPGMDQWFARGLCTDRMGRFQSAGEMAQAFRRVVAGEMLEGASGPELRNKARDNTGTVRIERGALSGERGASSDDELAVRSESPTQGVPKTERWGSNPGTANSASVSKGAGSGPLASKRANSPSGARPADGAEHGEVLSRGTLPSGEHPPFAATSSDWQASASNGITANTPLSAVEGSFGTEARGALTFNADAAAQRPRSRGVRMVALLAAAVAVGVAGATFWRSGEQSGAVASEGAGMTISNPEIVTGSATTGSASVGAAEIVLMPTPGGIDDQVNQPNAVGDDDGPPEIGTSGSVDPSASVGNTVTPPLVRSQPAKASVTPKAGANGSGRGSSKANADVATDQSMGGAGKGSQEGASPIAKEPAAKVPAQKKYRGF